MSTGGPPTGAALSEQHHLLELVLGRQPDVVPQARHFTTSALAKEHNEVAAEAELVVSELVTNAFLYGEPPIVVRLARLADRLRLEVEDAGPAMPVPPQRVSETMTGRGLSLVRTMSTAWGVERLPVRGKSVWAELALRGSTNGPLGGLEQDVDKLLEAWSDHEPGPSWYTVKLGPVPTDLLTSAKGHMDNVVRELTLMGEGEASKGNGLPAEVTALIETVTREFANVRADIKRQASAAAAAGEAITFLELRVQASVIEAGERYLEALDRADRYARSGRLLSLAPPAVHGIFRRWYVRSTVEYLRALTAGAQPPRPGPFSVVLAQELERLSHLDQTAAQLAFLGVVNQDLAKAQSRERMAEVVVDHLIELPSVLSARVRLLTPDDTLKSLAWRGGAMADPNMAEELPLSTELPPGLAVRTGRPVFVSSIKQLFDGFPEMRGHYDEDSSVHATPLGAGTRPRGVIIITFKGGELTDDARERLVEGVAGALNDALQRAELADREEEVRETLRFLADATSILVSAIEPGEVVARLVRHAVPRLGDWCTIYIVDGRVLRRMAVDIEGFPQVAARFKGTELSLASHAPAARAFVTGQVQITNEMTGQLLERLYPELDYRHIGGNPGQGSGVCVPMQLRGKRLGVIALTYLGSGRRVTPGVVEALTGLAARAALALENARRWSDEHQALQDLVAALLPSEPPALPGLDFAARYLPAAGDVAGDWWEADLMPDGTVLLGLGDAAGHGVGAVSQMCELRHGARALAGVDPSPAAMLADLSRRLSSPDSGFATAVYGRLRPGSGDLHWASAGHVPPIHVPVDRPARSLGYLGGVPLGAPGDAPPTDHHLVLALGDTVVLYSDGVVERRHERLDTGIERLVGTIERHRSLALDQLAERVIAEHCQDLVDDACLLMVRRVA